MMQRKVTKGRELLTEKLSGIKGGKVVLVFDGKKGEAESSSGSDPQVVVTYGGDENGEARQSADEWSVDALDESTANASEVQVVTADKEVRLAPRARPWEVEQGVSGWRSEWPATCARTSCLRSLRV